MSRPIVSTPQKNRDATSSNQGVETPEQSVFFASPKASRVVTTTATPSDKQSFDKSLLNLDVLSEAFKGSIRVTWKEQKISLSLGLYESTKAELDKIRKKTTLLNINQQKRLFYDLAKSAVFAPEDVIPVEEKRDMLISFINTILVRLVANRKQRLYAEEHVVTKEIQRAIEDLFPIAETNQPPDTELDTSALNISQTSAHSQSPTKASNARNFGNLVTFNRDSTQAIVLQDENLTSYNAVAEAVRFQAFNEKYITNYRNGLSSHRLAPKFFEEAVKTAILGATFNQKPDGSEYNVEEKKDLLKKAARLLLLKEDGTKVISNFKREDATKDELTLYQRFLSNIDAAIEGREDLKPKVVYEPKPQLSVVEQAIAMVDLYILFQTEKYAKVTITIADTKSKTSATPLSTPQKAAPENGTREILLSDLLQGYREVYATYRESLGAGSSGLEQAQELTNLLGGLEEYSKGLEDKELQKYIAILTRNRDAFITTSHTQLVDQSPVKVASSKLTPQGKQVRRSFSSVGTPAASGGGFKVRTVAGGAESDEEDDHIKRLESSPESYDPENSLVEGSVFGDSLPVFEEYDLEEIVFDYTAKNAFDSKVVLLKQKVEKKGDPNEEEQRINKFLASIDSEQNGEKIRKKEFYLVMRSVDEKFEDEGEKLYNYYGIIYSRCEEERQNKKSGNNEPSPIPAANSSVAGSSNRSEIKSNRFAQDPQLLKQRDVNKMSQILGMVIDLGVKEDVLETEIQHFFDGEFSEASRDIIESATAVLEETSFLTQTPARSLTKSSLFGVASEEAKTIFLRKVSEVRQKLRQNDTAAAGLQEQLRAKVEELQRKEQELARATKTVEDEKRRTTEASAAKLSALLENSSLQTQITTLTSAKEKAESEKGELQTQVASLSEELEKLKLQLQVFTEDDEGKNSQITTLTSQIKDKEIALAALLQELREKDALFLQKHSQLFDSSLREEGLKKEVTALTAKNKEWDEAASLTAQHVTEVKGENERLTRQLREQQKESLRQLGELQEKVAAGTASQQLVEELKEILRSQLNLDEDKAVDLKEFVENYGNALYTAVLEQQKVETLTKAIEDLQIRNDSLSSSEQENKNFKDEINLLREQLRLSEERNSTNNQRIEQFETTITSIKEASRLAASAQLAAERALDSEREAKEKAETERDEAVAANSRKDQTIQQQQTLIEAQQQQVRKLQEEKEALETQVSTASDELRALKDQLVILQEEREVNKTTIEGLERRINKKEEELTTSQRKLLEKTEEAKVLAQELEEVKRQKEALSRENEALQQINQQQKAAIDGHAAALKKIFEEGKIEGISENLETVSRRLAEQKSELEAQKIAALEEKEQEKQQALSEAQSQYQQQLDAKDTEIGAKEAIIREKDVAIATVETQKQEQAEEIATLKSQLAEQQQRFTEAGRNFDKEKAALEKRLEEQKLAHKTELARVTEEKDAAEIKAAALQTQLQAKESNLQDLQATMTSLQAQKDAAERKLQENSAASDEQIQQLANKVTDLESQIATQQESIEGKQQENDFLQAQITEQQQKIFALDVEKQEALLQVHKLTELSERIEEEKKTAQKQIEDAHRENEKLKTQFASEKEGLQQENSALERQAEEAARDNQAKLQKKEDELKKEFDAQKERYLKTIKSDYDRTLAEAETSFDSVIAAKDAEIASQTAKITSQTQKIDSLTQENLNLEEIVKQSEERNQELTNQLEALEGKSGASEQEVGELKAKIETVVQDAKAQISEKDTRLAELEQKLQEAEKKIETITQENVSLQTEKAELETANNELQERQNQLQESSAQTQLELQKLQEEKQQAEESLRKLIGEEEAGEAQESDAVSSEEQTSLQNMIDKIAEREKALQEKIEEQQEELLENKKQQSDFASKIKKLGSEISVLMGGEDVVHNFDNNPLKSKDSASSSSSAPEVVDSGENKKSILSQIGSNFYKGKDTRSQKEQSRKINNIKAEVSSDSENSSDDQNSIVRVVKPSSRNQHASGQNNTNQRIVSKGEVKHHSEAETNVNEENTTRLEEFYKSSDLESILGGLENKVKTSTEVNAQKQSSQKELEESLQMALEETEVRREEALQAKNALVDAETARQQAEQEKADAEAARQRAEQEKAAAEARAENLEYEIEGDDIEGVGALFEGENNFKYGLRKQVEDLTVERNAALQAQAAAEVVRQQAEQEKADAEAARQQAELARQRAEQERDQARNRLNIQRRGENLLGQQKVDEEAKRRRAEQEKAAAELARQRAEQERDQARHERALVDAARARMEQQRDRYEADNNRLRISEAAAIRDKAAEEAAKNAALGQVGVLQIDNLRLQGEKVNLEASEINLKAEKAILEAEELRLKGDNVRLQNDVVNVTKARDLNAAEVASLRTKLANKPASERVVTVFKEVFRDREVPNSKQDLAKQDLAKKEVEKEDGFGVKLKEAAERGFGKTKFVESARNVILANRFIKAAKGDSENEKMMFEENLKTKVDSSHSKVADLKQTKRGEFNDYVASTQSVSDLEIEYYKTHRNKILADRGVKDLSKAGEKQIIEQITKDKVAAIIKMLPAIVEKLNVKNPQAAVTKFNSAEMTVLLSVGNGEGLDSWKSDYPSGRINRSFLGELRKGSKEDKIRSKAVENFATIIKKYGDLFGQGEVSKEVMKGRNLGARSDSPVSIDDERRFSAKAAKPDLEKAANKENIDVKSSVPKSESAAESKLRKVLDKVKLPKLVSSAKSFELGEKPYNSPRMTEEKRKVIKRLFDLGFDEKGNKINGGSGKVN